MPKYLQGEIILSEIEKELKTSHQTFNKIVEEYYRNNGNTEGLELYEKIKKEN